MINDRSPYALRVRQLVFDSVARALPTMGRDFTVDVDVLRKGDERAGINLIITPLTPMGRVIAPLLREAVATELAKVGRKPNAG